MKRGPKVLAAVAVAGAKKAPRATGGSKKTVSPTAIKRVVPKSATAWRNWLEANHAKENAVEVVHHKVHTKKPSVSTMDAMHEAICFGWIDSAMKSIDEKSYFRRFHRRTAKAKWSKNTLKYAEKLIEEGRMAPAGLTAYKAGLAKPLVDAGIPANPEAPPELLNALKKEPKAKTHFDQLSSSCRRTHLRWLAMAKRDETKKKRIAELVKSFKEGKKLNSS